MYDVILFPLPQFLLCHPTIIPTWKVSEDIRQVRNIKQSKCFWLKEEAPHPWIMCISCGSKTVQGYEVKAKLVLKAIALPSRVKIKFSFLVNVVALFFTKNLASRGYIFSTSLGNFLQFNSASLHRTPRGQTTTNQSQKHIPNRNG